MKIISIMNYKGGVGKTTITANLGADLASRGQRVLLIDLDPQTNLTFCFYTMDEWRDTFSESRTIKGWYDGDAPGANIRLADLIARPERVNRAVESSGGRLSLISSDLGLIDIDLELAAQLGGSTTLRESKRRYLRVHGCLAASLAAEEFADYDMVLIDCAPNFGLVTKTAIVASDFVLVPAKADYLSTLGINYLVGRCEKLIAEYNDYVDHGTSSVEVGRSIHPRFLGVVFNMIQMYANQPIYSQRNYIQEVIANADVPVLSSTIRNSTRHFGTAGSLGMPAILSASPDDEVAVEFRRLTNEVMKVAFEGDHSER